MTTKETYKYLNSARDLRWAINKQKCKIKTLEERLYPSGVSYDGINVQTSFKDRQTDTLAKISDELIKLDALETRRREVEDRLGESIAMLHDDRTETILTEYYINCENISDIAKVTNYSRDWINALKSKGVRRLAKIISERQQ